MKIITRIFLMVFLLALTMLISKGEGQLSENFYNSSCPNVESIVSQAVTNKFTQTITTGQATLRLFFHDCFVEGCDASVIISSPNGDAEKDYTENLSLPGDGFDTVIKAKQAVEATCPGVVSCADILALATRDVIGLLGGPSFKVELGRRDGLISKASRVEGNLPKASFNLDQLNALFQKNGLTQTDMIALSGAHTVGFSHCDQFANRLYSFSSSNSVDPTLDATYAQELMAECPRNPDPTVAVALDPQTRSVFDNVYYQDLVSGKGLLSSDQVLFSDAASQPTVVRFANNAADFNEAFVAAIRKLGRVGVKTGKDGEIRRDCTTFNS
ncbi:peroxidase 55 [Vigna unguiculata]|uniref:Peroxidase n=1 Tax=Vigna unguiculata TaxID=3917 RepID=A0A4D6M490_VIGUN|nr:peroxidase 55 [Vigna unguiculata]QCD95398.1 peroxidase [Vigna unguiculata]